MVWVTFEKNYTWTDFDVKWFSYYGQDNRFEFWMLPLVLLGINISIGVLIGAFEGLSGQIFLGDDKHIKPFGFVLNTLIISMSFARRLRDTGTNPWWALMLIVPLLNLMLLLYAGIKPSAHHIISSHKSNIGEEGKP